MRDTILFWDSDPVLCEAISAALRARGYNPVGLPSAQIPQETLRALQPSLLILEGGWEKGAGIRLSPGNISWRGPADLAVILPRESGLGDVDEVIDGIVIGYVRKPFGSAQLLDAIKAANGLRDSLAWRKEALYSAESLEVRRLRDDSELEEALSLRREVYLETGYLDADSPPLDCDACDSRSIIMGAFVHSKGRRSLAGTLRIIRTEEKGPHDGAMERIAARHGMHPRQAKEHDRTLPACESFNVDPVELVRVQAGFGGILASNGARVSTEVCELSRLAVPAVWRRHRLGLERKLFDLVVVDSLAANPHRNWFVIAVHPGKRIKFHRYGFLAVNELGVRPYAGLDQPAILMTLDLQQYLMTPNPFTAGLDQEVLLYRTMGSLIHAVEERSLAAVG